MPVTIPSYCIFTQFYIVAQEIFFSTIAVVDFKPCSRQILLFQSPQTVYKNLEIHHEKKQMYFYLLTPFYKKSFVEQYIKKSFFGYVCYC